MLIDEKSKDFKESVGIRFINFKKVCRIDEEKIEMFNLFDIMHHRYKTRERSCYVTQ